MAVSLATPGLAQRVGEPLPGAQSRSEVDVPHEDLNPQTIPAPVVAPDPPLEPVEAPEEREGALAKLARIIRVWLFGPEPEIVQEMRCFTDKFGAKTCKLVDVAKTD
ncbi:hypothetical protein SAMN04487991_1806 [Celeribacter neptunius]|uniref:Uncharacterized protein n=2 Tax=Celeribacter neptunius TaxID=588602 RepID=A0A1I3QE02_9RHOB|nr:hypothetical protein SAMN04487991_1806 [Celeribacter neptunius]